MGNGSSAKNINTGPLQKMADLIMEKPKLIDWLAVKTSLINFIALSIVW